MAKTAFLGLGSWAIPWRAISRRRATRSRSTTALSRSREVGERERRQGGARTPAEAAAGQELVFACVGNDDDLRSVTLGAEGAFAGMAKGAIFVDHTTASADVARELHAAAKAKGLGFIDARSPVDRQAPRTAC